MILAMIFLFVSSKNDQFVRSFSIMSQRAYNIPREPKKQQLMMALSEGEIIFFQCALALGYAKFQKDIYLGKVEHNPSRKFTTSQRTELMAQFNQWQLSSFAIDISQNLVRFLQTTSSLQCLYNFIISTYPNSE